MDTLATFDPAPRGMAVRTSGVWLTRPGAGPFADSFWVYHPSSAEVLVDPDFDEKLLADCEAVLADSETTVVLLEGLTVPAGTTEEGLRALCKRFSDLSPQIDGAPPVRFSAPISGKNLPHLGLAPVTAHAANQVCDLLALEEFPLTRSIEMPVPSQRPPTDADCLWLHLEPRNGDQNRLDESAWNALERFIRATGGAGLPQSELVPGARTLPPPDSDAWVSMPAHSPQMGMLAGVVETLVQGLLRVAIPSSTLSHGCAPIPWPYEAPSADGQVSVRRVGRLFARSIGPRVLVTTFGPPGTAGDHIADPHEFGAREQPRQVAGTDSSDPAATVLEALREAQVQELREMVGSAEKSLIDIQRFMGPMLVRKAAVREQSAPRENAVDQLAIEVFSNSRAQGDLARFVREEEESLARLADAEPPSAIAQLTNLRLAKKAFEDLADRSLAILQAASSMDTAQIARAEARRMVSEGKRLEAEKQREAEVAEHRRRQETLVTTLGALVLVPSLVIGVFGASTYVPGEGTVGGFALMLAVAVILGLLTFAGLRTTRS